MADSKVARKPSHVSENTLFVVPLVTRCHFFVDDFERPGMR